MPQEAFPWWNVAADVQTLSGWIDASVLEDVLAELRLEDLELARFEDEGGPPEPIVEEPLPRFDVLWGERALRDRRRIGSYTGTSDR